MATDWQMTLQGALAIPELVGREEELLKIMARLQDMENTTPCIIFLHGPGGIGKTRLLLEIIDECKKLDIQICDKEQMIDVYHLLYHTPFEMTEAIYDSLKPFPESSSFRIYERDARVVENLRVSGEALRIEEQREQALRSFVNDLQKFANTKRVVIVIDTIERFVYGTEQLAGIPDIANVWKWLITELPNLSNVVLVAAGRPQAKSLLENISPTIEVLPLEVDEFSPEATREYLDAAARRARENKADEWGVQALESFTPEERRRAHQLTGGRPILLSLLADYVINGGQIAPLFAGIKAGTEEELQQRFREEILARLLKPERFGEIFRHLAMMPKGVDAELLAAAMKISMEEASAHLRQIERFSFVKVRRFWQKRQKDTYFLHDELYELFQKSIFAPPAGPIAKEPIYHEVIECYEERFRTVRRQLANLYSVMQAGGTGTIDYQALKDALAQRTEILLALLYYRLRQDPPKGYRRWFRYDHEATMSGDLVFSIQLQLELSAYLQELAMEKTPKVPGWENDLVRWSLLLRPIKHAWAEGKFAKALDESRKLEDDFSPELSDPLKKAMLSIWKAYAWIASDPPEAHDVLEKVIPELKAYRDASADEIRHWLAQMLLAFAYRVRGYAFRVQELIDRAIENYRQAAVLLRGVDIKIEMATVHNDLGFALALHGDWVTARSLVSNALELRRELGLGAQIARSLNTLAIIDTYEGRYPEAIENATKALNLFRATESARGSGMALIALAEATRRQSSTLIGAEAQARIDRLNRAFEMGDEALGIFEEPGKEEKHRQVDALIEKGCARRDAVRLLRNFGISLFGKEKWIKESQQALEKAAEIAKGFVKEPLVHHRQVDALVNLAWLGFYVGEEGHAIQVDAEKRAEALLKEYELPEGKPKPEIHGKPKYQPLLSTQLGKLYVLRGHQTYESNPDAWKERIEDICQIPARLEETYKKLAWYYCAGLEHSALYSPEYRDLRLAKQQIFDNLKILRPTNLELLMKKIGEFEKYYGISPRGVSHLRQLLIERALWSNVDMPSRE